MVDISKKSFFSFFHMRKRSFSNRSKLIEFLKTILSLLFACAELFTNWKSITFIELGFNLCRLLPKLLNECSLEVTLKFNHSTGTSFKL